MIWIRSCFILLLLPAISLQGQSNSPPDPGSMAQQEKFSIEISYLVPAKYPAEALANRMQGTVSITVVISPTGDVERAEATDGDAVIQQAALAAAKQYKFKTRRGDQYLPVKCWAQLLFEFRLNDATAAPSVPTPAVPGRLFHGEEFPKSVRVSEIAMEGMRLKTVPPAYPRKGGNPVSGGTVVLGAVIGTDGKVKNLTLLSGPGKLGEAAEDAVRQWEYRPYVLMGEPVPVETQITMKFGIDQNPLPPAVLQWMVENPNTILKQVVVHQSSSHYPEAAKQKGRQGGVVVIAKINRDGKLGDLQVSRGDPLFNQAALEVASEQNIIPQTKTDPAKLHVAVVVEFVK